MPKFRVEVVEMRKVETSYLVEANSPKEAIKKAKIGDTVREDEGDIETIVHREVISEPEEEPEIPGSPCIS